MNVLDEELLARLRVELDALTSGVASEPPPLGATVSVARVVDLPRRDRRRLIVLAAAVIALISGVAGLIAIRRDHDAVGTPEPSAATAPVVTFARSPGVVHLTPPTPDGWDLVEWNNVRLALPPDMSPFRPGNGCDATLSTANLNVTCGDQFVRIESATLGGTPDQTINGLHAVLRVGECTGCQTIDIYELATTVTVRRIGDTPLKIIDTVGPSGGWRYQNEPRPTPPSDWKTVEFVGVSLRVPQDWSTATTVGIDDGCVFASKTFEVDPLPCADHTLRAPVDGAQMYLSDAPINAHIGWPEQTITTQNDGGQTVVLRVGFGADPNIGLAILSSITMAAPTDVVPTMPSSVEPLPYLALGESVMLGAKPDLDQHGIRTIAGITADPAWTLQQLKQVRSTSPLTQGAVIQLGTNGAVTREQYDALLVQLADVPRVVVLTVTGSRPWIDGNNEIIRSLSATHPNVFVVDWEARSAEVADHLASDGIHLGDEVAKAFYTNLILEALGLPTS